MATRRASITIIPAFVNADVFPDENTGKHKGAARNKYHRKINPAHKSEFRNQNDASHAQHYSSDYYQQKMKMPAEGKQIKTKQNKHKFCAFPKILKPDGKKIV